MECTLTDLTNQLLRNSINSNKQKLSKSSISTIHPEVFLKYSSINVFLGKQGSGKTFTMNKEFVKLSLLAPTDVHLIVFACKDNRIDETFESMCDNITIPVVKVSYDDIIDYLHDLVFHKMIYDKVVNEHLEDKIEDEQINELMDFLHIDDFTRKSLQEIIVFDDAAYKAILMKPSSEIVSLIHEARHYKFIFCFCVQGIKSIPLAIKEQMTTLFLFPGFIKQKLATIFQQSGINSCDYDDFKEIYRRLEQRDFIMVDCRKGTFSIVDGKL